MSVGGEGGLTKQLPRLCETAARAGANFARAGHCSPHCCVGEEKVRLLQKNQLQGRLAVFVDSTNKIAIESKKVGSLWLLSKKVQ